MLARRGSGLAPPLDWAEACTRPPKQPVRKPILFPAIDGVQSTAGCSVAPGSEFTDDVAVTSSDATDPVPTRWTEATVYADMWVDPDDDPREADAGAVDERGVLLDYLRHYRLTLEMECAGLSVEQLARRSVLPSTMSLLGLVRHAAEEERHLRRVMAGEDEPKLYCTDEDRNGDWDDAVDEPAVVEDAWRQWRAEMERTD